MPELDGVKYSYDKDSASHKKYLRLLREKRKNRKKKRNWDYGDNRTQALSDES